jgi:hypothetical protein
MNWFKKHLDSTIIIVYAIFAFITAIVGTMIFDNKWASSSFWDVFHFFNESIPALLVAFVCPFWWLINLNSIFMYKLGTLASIQIGLLVIAVAFLLISVGWIIRQKNRRLSWIILAFIPLAFVLYMKLKSTSHTEIVASE